MNITASSTKSKPWRRPGPKGYRPRARNSLYALAAEYKRRHPQATAAEAWKHFAVVADICCGDVVVRYDGGLDILTYLPDPDRRTTRTVKKRSFEQRYYSLSNV